MASLAKDLRRELERTVIKARRVGVEGAQKALESLAVGNEKPWPSMTDSQKNLRVRLRAHGRQLGDRVGATRDTQTIGHLVQECAYEHWHRMLFARFLAENNLLIEPESKVPISLEECRELAMERGTDWLALASDFAVRMLPQIFRKGDPVLEVALPPETRHELEDLLKGLPTEVFAADDSLGWVYQFWQSEQKDEVNSSEKKIGADELPAVTQLFTEDYMVLFLLHNTLGAWWTAKRKAEGKDPVLPGYEWTYLRLKEDGTPAAGSFEGWPRAARDLKVLDPCMGSGHFLVFALPILVGFRMEEEGLSRDQAVEAVLRDNLFGLELDNRCTQIAAFNLALSAWRKLGNFKDLPQLNLACSGLGINAREEDWLKLAAKDHRVRETMRALYRLFQQSPILGSLIDPKRAVGPLFATDFEKVRPVLVEALTAEQPDVATSELAVAAQGIVKAAQILSDEFSLVVTNVPYLGRGKQEEALREYCDHYHPSAKFDLATCFVERCASFSSLGRTAALVSTQYWMFLTSYKKLRQQLLTRLEWALLARLGPRAFETISGEVVNVAMWIATHRKPDSGHEFGALDVADQPTPALKAASLRSVPLKYLKQTEQLQNPDARIIHESTIRTEPLLSEKADVYQGLITGDRSSFIFRFWELEGLTQNWSTYVDGFNGELLPLGRENVIFWERGKGRLYRLAAENRDRLHDMHESGNLSWGRKGVLLTRIGLHATPYYGEQYDNNLICITPYNLDDLVPLWNFCSSSSYRDLVRELDQKLSLTNATACKVRVDLKKWRHPESFPAPLSNDPTQSLFNGHPKGSERPLQVAVARLVGYRWPRQTGSSFMDCPQLSADGLERHADHDGIVCLSPVKGERAAADRLRALLADAYGSDWSASKQAELLSQIVYTEKKLEDWLRDGFFEQHCDLFHQRPFVWHIWDGLRDGFHALVNYHKLVTSNGEGRRTLEKLIYTYLGDWIDRQRADLKNGIEGADARVAAAVHLQSELKKILAGDPPYDIFVRWKPLHEQPIGWEPDINDGVRINIRPFMTAKVLNGRGKSSSIFRDTPKIKWDKDRGKEPNREKEEFPWFWFWDESTADFAGGKEFDGNRWNDLHYTSKFKQDARERHAADKRHKG